MNASFLFAGRYRVSRCFILHGGMCLAGRGGGALRVGMGEVTHGRDDSGEESMGESNAISLSVGLELALALPVILDIVMLGSNQYAITAVSCKDKCKVS